MVETGEGIAEVADGTAEAGREESGGMDGREDIEAVRDPCACAGGA